MFTPTIKQLLDLLIIKEKKNKKKTKIHIAWMSIKMKEKISLKELHYTFKIAQLM